jgi:DNA gyrase subunit A
VTEVTTPPTGGEGGRDRVEARDLQLEMQQSYLDYAMSVIVGRALPDVRDGLKPVHRRVIYAMYDGGYRPDRGYNKCARVVGDVMGNYHPHGDTAIYDTLVRLAQTWSLRYPLVDGQGNFGSPGNDPAAAMRYCVAGGTRIRTVDQGTVRIEDLVPGARPGSDTDVDVKVLDHNGDPARATKFFHSGANPTLKITTRSGYQLVGTRNHPVLCLVSVGGVPALRWRLLEEIARDDLVVLQRTPVADHSADHPSHADTNALAELVGDRRPAHRVPAVVWNSGASVKAAFLRALFTSDGSACAHPREGVRVRYSAGSERLAREAQQLLLEFGVLSRIRRRATGELEVVVTGRRDVRLFSSRIGFRGHQQTTLVELLRTVSDPSAMSSERVPYVARFLRSHGASRWTEREWLRRHDLDRVEGWERDGDEIRRRITPEAAAVVEPLVDGRFSYARVARVEDAGVRPVYSLRVDTDAHAFITNGFVSHNTECRMAPLAMEMVRDIDEDTVDFAPNYDGRSQEPAVLPSRFPNLLVNGSAGIAVGMATNIPSHNLREIASGVRWYLDHPTAAKEELLEALLARVQGPDFPTGALVMGRRGIEEAYRTGRGSITMRSVVEVEEIQNRTCLVVTELPYQVNPDNLAYKIAELVKDGRLGGVADVRDETSGRTGQRLVIVLKRDAVAKVVLNNLYKHTQLQDTFGANMLALVDGVPRTLTLDAFVRHWVGHQLDVIRRRTAYRLAEAEKRAHILRGLVKALDALDEVIALIRRSPSVEEARDGLIGLLDVDEVQADAILNMQLRRLAALERQKIVDELARIETEIEEYKAILASDERQRSIVSEELGQIVERYGDERRTRIVPFDGDMSVEDLIPEEPVVVTITRGGYAKRTKTDLYRSQRRGGKGVRGAQLRQDDIVDHFFVTTTHDWILFFTNQGRVYRAKAYELPEGGRDARGQHVANLLAFQPGEHIAEVLDLRDYAVAPYLVLATKSGLVKKTRLEEYDSNRAGGLIAINLREGDELISARLVGPDDDLLLVSRKGMSVRFTPTDDALRPMGRATSGVVGMRFREDDELLAMDVVRPGTFVFTVTDEGYAKRTPVEEYRLQGRGGLGIQAMRFSDARGSLVGALIVAESDEVLAIRAGGGVTRSAVSEVKPTGRATMGVTFVRLGAGDSIVAIARNAEAAPDVVAEVGNGAEAPAPASAEVAADEAVPERTTDGEDTDA